MKHDFNHEMGAILTGAVTGATFGSILFQAISTFFLGVIGACGGWVFISFIQPWLQKKFNKKKVNKA